MPYVVPTFNLVCNIWREQGTGGTYASPDLVEVCNLTPGKRSITPRQVGFIGTTVGSIYMELLLPALTDIRASYNGNDVDLVEVPAGTGRFYNVVYVDDIGKGFSNEHRIAFIVMMSLGAVQLTPPVPMTVPML